MRELLPFGKSRRPNVDTETQVSAIVQRGLLSDFKDAEKVYCEPGDYDGYALVNSERNVVNIIAVPAGEPLGVETMKGLEEHYSTPENSVTCVMNPAPEVVYQHWLELGIILES